MIARSFTILAPVALMLVLAGVASADEAAPASTASAATDQPASAPKPPIPAEEVFDAPPLSAVDWIGPGVDLDALYGQTVVIAFAETWCPICNGWAPKFSKQVADAAKELSATVIYLGVGASKAGFDSYLKQHKIEGQAAGVIPVSIAREFGFTETLWRAAVINPQGKQVLSGNFGTYVASGANNGKNWIAVNLSNYAMDEKPLVVAGDNPNLAKADLATRLGLFDVALRLLTSAGDDGKASKERVVAHGRRMLDASKAYESTDPYLAWRLARVVAREFKSQEYGKEASALENALNQNEAVRAGKAGDTALARLNEIAKKRPDKATLDGGFTQIVAKYKETHAGRIAARALEPEESSKPKVKGIGND